MKRRKPKHQTPEGAEFAQELAGGDAAEVHVIGQTACSCGCGQEATVTLSLGNIGIVAKDAATIDELIAALVRARLLVFGEPG